MGFGDIDRLVSFCISLEDLIKNELVLFPLPPFSPPPLLFSSPKFEAMLFAVCKGDDGKASMRTFLEVEG